MIDIREQIEDLLTRPGHQLGRGARFLRLQIDLWRFCARRLQEHNLGAMSAALSFRTIFALIPMLVLAFLVIKSMGVVEDGKIALRKFLDTSGISQLQIKDPNAVNSDPNRFVADPNTAANLQANSGADPNSTALVSAADQIELLVNEVEQKLTFDVIGPIGALVMIWTAMTLLTTIESALNRIFGAPRSRSLARRVVMFWSALTLGPILIMAAVYASNKAITVAEQMPLLGWLPATVGWLMPGVVGILVVAAGYKLIPNTPVRFQAAIGGAMVAVPAWMVARWGFAIYVQEFVADGNVYGVLGLLPLFLLWVNVSWSIFLFGAELAHTATNLSQLRLGETASRTVLGPSDWLAVAVAIARPFENGKGPVSLNQMVQATELPAESIQRVLDRLSRAELVNLTAEEQPSYVLMKPAQQVSLLEIIDLADPRAIPSQVEDPTGVRQIVTDAQETARKQLASQTLADLCHMRPRDVIETIEPISAAATA